MVIYKMSSAVYNNFLKAFPHADANIQVANINAFLKNKEIQTYTPLSLNGVVENVKTSNMITVTKNFDILLSVVGDVAKDSLLEVGDLLYIGGKFSVEYKGITHKNFISFNKVTGEINGFNGLGSAYDLSTGGIIENAGSIYVSFSNIQESPFSTLYKITNNVSSLIEIPESLYVTKMAFDKNGKFYICGYLGLADYAAIYEYSETTTWNSITGSIPGFRCRGFAFDTNNVLYAVCNTSDKKCLYRKALDSNEWTALVDGEIMSDIKSPGETILTEPDISINKYNEVYIYGDFTQINGQINGNLIKYISRYNERGHAFEILDGSNFFYFYYKPFGVSAAVFDEKGDLYINGGIYVEKLIFDELMPLDINYSNNDYSQIQYSMLINNEELIVSYVRDTLYTDLVRHKLNGKKTVITDKQLQYTTKTEQQFRYNADITSIYRNTIVSQGIYRYNIFIGGDNIDRYDNRYNDINSPLVTISEYTGDIDYITSSDISRYESIYIGGNKSNDLYLIGSYTKLDSVLNYISDLVFFGNDFVPINYKSPDETYIQKVQFNDTNIYINARKFQLTTNDSFVYEISKNTNTWTNISSSIENFYCYSICLDKNDNLYALGYTGDNTSGGSLFLKNKDDNEWVALPSGNLFFRSNSGTIDLVSDNNGELYICGSFVKIGESDIAYIAKYNKTLEAFESVGDVLQSAVKNIAFDSKNNIYIAQDSIDEKNIKTLDNNVWKYVNVCDKKNWAVSGVIDITDDVLTASYLGFSDKSGRGDGPFDFESIVSYDLKTKKRTYPGWETKTTKVSSNILEFNELGQSVEIFTDVNDPYTNAIILNKSEGVKLLYELPDEVPNEETRSKQSKNVRQVKEIKDIKSEKGLLKQLNTKPVFGVFGRKL